MILKGKKKKVLKEIVRYYVESTGNAYEDFISTLQAGKDVVIKDYATWLALKGFEILEDNGITVDDCIENKDVIHASVKADKSRQEGEFYTPEIWCKEGRDYLKNILGDLWGKAYVYDASCGSGNLMRTSNYPQDKLFLSTLLDEDVPIVQSAYPDATVFQCDFLNDIDWDENNAFFSDKLPKKLVEVLKNNEPLIFYMNPPYKVMEATKTDVGTYMKDRGMGKCALDIFHQFMYRLVMLKRFYNHTNMHAGIFGPVTMYHSEMVEPLYNDFRSEFDFTGGMCFTAGDFSNTSESVDWIVSYTCWSSHERGVMNPTPMKLEAKAIDRSSGEEVIKTIGSRTIQNVEDNIHYWVKAKDICNYEYMPEVTSLTGLTGKLAKYPTNALACIMSSNYVIRATRRACVTSLPNTDNVPVTEDNFWKAVASYGARRCYATSQNPFNNCQYLSSPNTTKDGYEQWLIDCLTIFLFDYSALLGAYRGIEIDGEVFNINNKLFPLSIEEVMSLTTDEVVLEDARKFEYDNSFILNILDNVKDRFSPKAKALYDFGIGMIKESLRGTYRKDENYVSWTQSWDSGFAQVRELKTLFTDEVEAKYTELLNAVRTDLLYGVYKYGIMEDALGECVN